MLFYIWFPCIAAIALITLAFLRFFLLISIRFLLAQCMNESGDNFLVDIFCEPFSVKSLIRLLLFRYPPICVSISIQPSNSHIQNRYISLILKYAGYNISLLYMKLILIFIRFYASASCDQLTIHVFKDKSILMSLSLKKIYAKLSLNPAHKLSIICLSFFMQFSFNNIIVKSFFQLQIELFSSTYVKDISIYSEEVSLHTISSCLSANNYFFLTNTLDKLSQKWLLHILKMKSDYNKHINKYNDDKLNIMIQLNKVRVSLDNFIFLAKNISILLKLYLISSVNDGIVNRKYHINKNKEHSHEYLKYHTFLYSLYQWNKSSIQLKCSKLVLHTCGAVAPREYLTLVNMSLMSDSKYHPRINIKYNSNNFSHINIKILRIHGKISIGYINSIIRILELRMMMLRNVSPSFMCLLKYLLSCYELEFSCIVYQPMVDIFHPEKMALNCSGCK